MDYLLYYLSGIIILPALIFSIICQSRVKSNFKKYSQIRNSRNISGAEAAYRLLQINGITDVKIVPIGGTLTDHYDPRTKQICLSQDVYNSTSVAAVGIACHEAGHACQHAEEYFPLKIRNAAIPATRIGSNLGIPLVLAGLFFSFQPLTYIGIVLYALVVLFQLLTLPVEFNASRRALATIENNQLLVGDEYSGAKHVLTAAALTYVAALASSLATLLRLIFISGRRR